MARVCTICREPYYPETFTDPAEKCLCGEMAYGGLWDWDRHRAIFKAARYRLAVLCFWAGNSLVGWR